MSAWRWEITSRIAERRVVAIVRAPTADEALEISTVLIDAGLDAIELPLTVPGALGAIERLAARRPDALVGAGTVLDAPSARAAILAGARFLVSPGISREVVETAHRYGAAAIDDAAGIAAFVPYAVLSVILGLLVTAAYLAPTV
ncbi:bifunctional 4-hydroxy-2-oxoglutarate aldolase/2-dehydro-3-deoxy-phosphogluconate aldolase, partial [Patulibacter sp. S7RM1-6]